MEIAIAIFAYILFCVITFFIKYAYDISKIWGDGEPIKLSQPSLNDFQENAEERFHRIYNSTVQKYVEKIITPSALYFHLRKDIENYQYDASQRTFPGFFLQLFCVLLSATMLLRSEMLDSWILSILIVGAICVLSAFIIDLIYKRHSICHRLRAKHFPRDEAYYKRVANYNDFPISYENNLNNITIKMHYQYLLSIEHTVIQRYYLRKMISKIEFLVYVLFFFTIPEY